METKLSKLKKMAAAGDWRGALKLAASWPQLGEHRDAIRRGWAGMSQPDFYRQLGENPDQLVADGIAALKARYGLGDTE